MKNLFLSIILYITLIFLACKEIEEKEFEKEELIIENSIIKENSEELKINNQYEIIPSELKLNLLSEYSKKHYGEPNIYLNNPQIIVIHSTETENLEKAVNVFKNEILTGRADIEFGGEVNVGTHFLIDTNGEIYSNTPIDYMARHTIGFNHTAISVENIGFYDNLTKEQLYSNVKLIEYLKNKYNSIKYVIGHYEYKDSSLPHFELYKELDENYIRTVKMDPGTNFMKEIREMLKN